MLEETGKLSEAYLYSEGPQLALSRAMELAQERVQLVWELLPRTSPLTAQHLAQAEKLAEDTRSIRAYLRDKLEG